MESSSSSSSLAAAANTNSTSSATSELFICFTSRLSSSSSMKLSSKSILSPGRARDSSQISLSSSLSRRLKNSGSLKGGQASPMFPTAAGKKRSGCAFENPEPSSPKVTCIGQVRVKTKKQGKKMRSRSAKRRSNNGGGGGGEASFRRMEKEKKNKEEETTTQKLEENRTYNNSDSINNNHHNQKWTICEALRAFGAEFNCFLPCRSSCTTAAAEEKESGKADKRISTSSANGRSCGAVFARWLVALQDGEGKRREIELVVGEDEEEREREERERSGGKSLRRRVFEGIEFKEEEIRKSCKDDGEGEEEEEKARVSICIPPKNALLLMRCRSDPVKMAALANRFWDPPPKDDDDEEDEDDDEKVNHEQEVCEDDNHGGEAEAEVEELAQAVDRDDLHQQPWECERKSVSSTTELVEREEDGEESEQMKLDRKEDVVEEAAVEEAVMEDENEENPKRISTDDQVVVDVGGLWDEVQEVVEPAEEKDCEQHQQQEDNGGDVEEEEGEEEKDEEEEEEKQELDHVIQSRQELQEQNTDLSGLFSEETFVDLEDKEKVEEEEHVQDEEDDSHCQEEEQKIEEKAEEEVAEGSTAEEEEAAEEATEPETREEKTGREDPKEEREMGSPGLPDCLLLMMCEPKLSMEVSKETWVCSTDFIRWLPERRRVNPKKAPEEPKKRPNAAAVAAVVDGPQVMQPPRSSCSFPVTGTAVPESMASVIEQKLVGTKPPYEPFVLTRCKSEPMRSAAKLAPDACFWKNRKLERHRPATLGVGAAGVGF